MFKNADYISLNICETEEIFALKRAISLLFVRSINNSRTGTSRQTEEEKSHRELVRNLWAPNWDIIFLHC
jgi:hypothetical protein